MHPGGDTSRKVGWSCAAHFPNHYPIYDQNLRFLVFCLWPDENFDTLFMTIAADTVA